MGTPLGATGVDGSTVSDPLRINSPLLAGASILARVALLSSRHTLVVRKSTDLSMLTIFEFCDRCDATLTSAELAAGMRFDQILCDPCANELSGNEDDHVQPDR